MAPSQFVIIITNILMIIAITTIIVLTAVTMLMTMGDEWWQCRCQEWLHPDYNMTIVMMMVMVLMVILMMMTSSPSWPGPSSNPANAAPSPMNLGLRAFHHHLSWIRVSFLFRVEHAFFTIIIIQNHMLYYPAVELLVPFWKLEYVDKLSVPLRPTPRAPHLGKPV